MDSTAIPKHCPLLLIMKKQLTFLGYCTFNGFRQGYKFLFLDLSSGAMIFVQVEQCAEAPDGASPLRPIIDLKHFMTTHYQSLTVLCMYERNLRNSKQLALDD
jgi:hypothetical protein